MRWRQLEERCEGREAKIWLINTWVDGDKLKFELGYLGDGYGGQYAVLVPVGGDSPQIRVTVPKPVQNLQNGVILAEGGYFTIEGSIE